MSLPMRVYLDVTFPMTLKCERLKMGETMIDYARCL